MSVNDVAFRLLARREHSEKELREKLLSREFPTNDVEACLQALKHEGLLSDQRFAESFIRVQAGLGKGPERIRALLFSRGVCSETVLLSMDAADIDWYERASAVLLKKFGAMPPMSLAERARQEKFLYYRGFSSDIIRSVVGETVKL